MRIEFDVTPMGAPRQTTRDRWGTNKRPIIEKYHAFRDELRLKANVAKYRVGEELNVSFVFPMPQNWSKAEQARMDGMPHQRKPDIDNAIKAVLDALCEDDSYIHTVRASKVWGREGKITITVLE